MIRERRLGQVLGGDVFPADEESWAEAGSMRRAGLQPLGVRVV